MVIREHPLPSHPMGRRQLHQSPYPNSRPHRPLHLLGLRCNMVLSRRTRVTTPIPHRTISIRKYCNTYLHVTSFPFSYPYAVLPLYSYHHKSYHSKTPPIPDRGESPLGKVGTPPPHHPLLSKSTPTSLLPARIHMPSPLLIQSYSDVHHYYNSFQNT